LWSLPFALLRVAPLVVPPGEIVPTGAPPTGCCAVWTVERLSLPEQLPVDHPCLAHWLKPKLLIERAREFVVSSRDRLTQTEGVFGLKREAPACLVKPVERDRLLGKLKRARRIVAGDERPANRPDPASRSTRDKGGG
jgi:hypothetical protein